MIKLGNPKRIVMAGVTLGCALGIGYLMQLSSPQAGAGQAQASDVTGANALSIARAFSGESVPKPKAVDAKDGAGLSVMPENDPGKVDLFDTAARPTQQGFEVDGMAFENVELTAAVPMPPRAAPQPRALPDVPVQLAALQDVPIRSFPEEERAPALICDSAVEMAARTADAAMVTLELTAPCHADTQFTLHHHGMMFSAITDGDGVWSMQVPALARNALFIAAFEDGDSAVATAVADTVEQFDRYVVQWQGRSGLQFHALEYGAAYGEDGHVWNEAAHDATRATLGEGGFLLRLGEGVIVETTLMAEVYTFPTQTALRDGAVQLSIETEVNAANCGRDITAQALSRPGGGEITARELTLAIPDCDAVGDFLVLKNLHEDLKIARN